MSDSIQRLRTLLAKDEVRSISRRYFISNGFDGTLTAVGVVVGSFLSGVSDGGTVVAVGIGAAIGLGTSAVWSVWEIERAEKQIELQQLEEQMLTELEDTRLQRQAGGERVIHAVASGMGPLVGILLPLLPFVFEGAVLSMYQATLGGVAIGVLILFSFGAYLGAISKQRWYVAGIRMGLAGLVVAAINVLLPG